MLESLEYDTNSASLFPKKLVKLGFNIFIRFRNWKALIMIFTSAALFPRELLECSDYNTKLSFRLNSNLEGNLETLDCLVILMF